MKSPTSLLFAYGTLLTGTGNAALDRLVKRCLTPVTDAVTPGTLYWLGAYPGAVPDPACDRVIQGTLVQVRRPRLCWPVLDRYEDCGRLYTRERISAFALQGSTAVECWIYRYQGRIRHRAIIPGGDFVAYRGRRGNRVTTLDAHNASPGDL